jgi:hypothetical protein
MKMRDLLIARNMAKRLHNKLIKTCPDCKGPADCVFQETICLDVGTVIANLDLVKSRFGYRGEGGRMKRFKTIVRFFIYIALSALRFRAIIFFCYIVSLFGKAVK